MKSVQWLKNSFALVAVLVTLAVIFILFELTDIAFRVWDRLTHTSTVFLVFYGLMVLFVALVGVVLVVKICAFGRPKTAKKKPRRRLNIAELKAKIARARAQGIDVSSLERDLAAAEQEVLPARLDVAFFGKISTGKSSLIQTILPTAHIDISIIGGSTSTIAQYHLDMPSGLALTFYDMPGTFQADALETHEKEVREVATRAHLVAYVLDQDITASDHQDLERLKAFGKPLLVILNKIERYDEEERALLEGNIVARLPPDADFVCADSAHEAPVSVRGRDGIVRVETRVVGGDIHALLEKLAGLSSRQVELAQSQRQALLALADESLRERVKHFRHQRAEALVKSYARKAMVGGVAAIGPGTDILIQGYLGVDMLKTLTKLYEVTARDIDLHHLAAAASGKVRTQLTVLLALAGNVCKAFPGVGTVLGGASHAIAYGLIFESLGRAVMQTLEQQGAAETLDAPTVVEHFEEQLRDDLEQRARKLVRLALNRPS